MLKKYEEPVLREPTKLEFEGIKNIMNRKGWILNENKTHFTSLNNEGFVIDARTITIKQEFNPVSEIAVKTNKVVNKKK